MRQHRNVDLIPWLLLGVFIGIQLYLLWGGLW